MMELGYKIVENLLEVDRVKKLHEVLTRFHHKWIEENLQFYQTRAVNSAFLTSPKFTSEEDRNFLFDLISDESVLDHLPEGMVFLNTQLFFDPVNKEQKNYWHRDVQYTPLSIEEQRKQVEKNPNNVVHVRIPVVAETGIELIPGTHNRWDTELEFNTRLEQNSRKKHYELLGGEKIRLDLGDALIFSANMIHRGLYGDKRMAFDVVYCQNDPDYTQYRDNNCIPTKSNHPIFR